ncbi:MAG: ABC transporter ATP-binding protein [Alphaproteobacteria bacterium]
MAEVRLEFRGVTKQFADRSGSGQTVTAVENVSLGVRDGEVVSLIGPSGCGKSTLLNMASGLNGPTKGEVYVDGAPVVEVNENVAFMLQKDLLLAWRSIRENVEFGLEIQGVPRAERRARSEDWLERCHIADFADHYPHQLSGGMRQRAALARTLVTDPHVLLLDEPFSALDAQTKMILQQDLATTLNTARKTALFITHDLVEAVAMSDRVLVMSQRPGTIIEEIVIEIPGRENPMERRKDDRIGPYVGQLMSLLHVGEVDLAKA